MHKPVKLVPQGQKFKDGRSHPLVLAGQFPAPTGQFVTAVQSPFFPLNTVSQGASAASRVQTNISDAKSCVVYFSGYLQMVIGSKA